MRTQPCDSCGHDVPRSIGFCPACKRWTHRAIIVPGWHARWLRLKYRVRPVVLPKQP